MTAPFPPPGAAFAASLDDLDPVATHALRLLRMWSWGVVHRETLRLAAATQFGAARGTCVVGAFESLFALLETVARPRLDIRPPDSHRLTDDERWFLALTAAALVHAPTALGPLTAGRVDAGAGPRVAESIHGFARTLADCLAGRPRPAAAECPIACPLQSDCSDRPRLEVVK